MDLKNSFTTAWRMFILNAKGYKEAAKADFKTAMLNFLIASVAIAIVSAVFTFNPLTIVAIPFLWILFLLGNFIGTFVFWIFALMFGGKATYMQQYNSSSYLSFVGIPGSIPFIGFFFSLWVIPMYVVLVREIHKLSTGKAIAAVLIPYALLFLVAVLFAIAMLALVGAALGASGMSLTELIALAEASA